jgi:hypothetical protein
MIGLTLLAVFTVGSGVVMTVLQPPASIAKARLQRSSDTAMVQAADRSPASAEPQFSTLALDDKGTQAIDFTLPCEDKTRFAKNIVQVRLIGSLCAENPRAAKQEIETSEIRNMTNGFSATVFYPKSSSFTTDYMTLAPGTNHIKISHILKAGARVDRDFTIDRL